MDASRPKIAGMTDTSLIDFGKPVKVDPKNRPPSPVRGGKNPVKPAYIAWLKQLEPGSEYEMMSKDADKAHSISRLNALRKVAKELSLEDGKTYIIDSFPVEKGKRYRIFGSVKDQPLKVVPKG